jgi:hypothetical protein
VVDWLTVVVLVLLAILISIAVVEWEVAEKHCVHAVAAALAV